MIRLSLELTLQQATRRAARLYREGRQPRIEPGNEHEKRVTLTWNGAPEETTVANWTLSNHRALVQWPGKPLDRVTAERLAADYRKRGCPARTFATPDGWSLEWEERDDLEPEAVQACLPMGGAA